MAIKADLLHLVDLHHKWVEKVEPEEEKAEDRYNKVTIRM
jgi:hypothetical protein